MKIKVTQEHIDNGVRVSPTGCAGVLALQDMGIPVISIGIQGALVGATECVAYVGDRGILLGKEMSGWISDFDSGKRVEPCTFEFPDYEQVETSAEVTVEAILVSV